MTKYRVFYETTASTYVEVEADDPEDAAEKADEEFHAPRVCAHCSGWGQPAAGIDLGEWESCDEVPYEVAS